MDILDNLLTWLGNPMVKWAFPIVVVSLYLLFLIGRGIFRALFLSKGISSQSKSFSVEVEENHNQPMGNSESIGSISMRLGEDVRDVWEMCYSNEQINGVLTGKYSLEDLYKMKPEGKR
ncbi:MAG: hypothetical protein FIB03_09655 [Anaerolineae bacterium]|nr:hypothetical protein [Anaerolineae bacterium]